MSEYTISCAKCGARRNKATRQRDNWKARAVKYKEAMEILRDELSRVRDVVGEVDAGIIDGVLARTVLREGKQ